METESGMEIGHVHQVFKKPGALVIQNTACRHICREDSVRIDGLKDEFPIQSLQVNGVDREEIFPGDDLFGLIAAGLRLRDTLRRKKVFLVPKGSETAIPAPPLGEPETWQEGKDRPMLDGG